MVIANARVGAQNDGELVAGLDRVGGNLFAADEQNLTAADQSGQVPSALTEGW
jgi:hypothetical protein